MPLHLLGKKSWNVYNQDNIERVRRDEAAAKAKEEAEEQRMQEEDAARRTAVLRGDVSAAFLSESATTSAAVGQLASGGNHPSQRRSTDEALAKEGGRERKRRRLRGEDDTDRDIRWARENAEAGEKARASLVKKGENEIPLVDDAGHLQLVPAPSKDLQRVDQNAEAETEKLKERGQGEDRYSMRFSNAAGFRNSLRDPWYAAKKPTVPEADTNASLAFTGLQEKDVWGNEDPQRKERERNRISSNDPFAAMQQAQRQLKQSEAERTKWQREKAAELDDLRKDQERRERRERKHRHRRRSEDKDSLKGFSLDSAAGEKREPGTEGRRRHRQSHRRHRSRSRSREQERHRHRHRSSHRD